MALQKRTQDFVFLCMGPGVDGMLRDPSLQEIAVA